MYEVEVKVPADLERVRERLETLEAGARPLESVVQVDTYYDAPHRSFPETDEALRIRSERKVTEAESDGGDGDERTKITYKGPLVDDESKTREEVETTVGDRPTMDALLTNLGFEAAATVRKSRDRYAVSVEDLEFDPDETDCEFEDTAVEELIVTLDEVDGVGEYVEVETEVEGEFDPDLEAAREAAYALLERLGLDPDDGIRTSYLGLLLEDS